MYVIHPTIAGSSSPPEEKTSRTITLKPPIDEVVLILGNSLVHEKHGPRCVQGLCYHLLYDAVNNKGIQSENTATTSTAVSSNKQVRDLYQAHHDLARATAKQLLDSDNCFGFNDTPLYLSTLSKNKVSVEFQLVPSSTDRHSQIYYNGKKKNSGSTYQDLEKYLNQLKGGKPRLIDKRIEIDLYSTPKKKPSKQKPNAPNKFHSFAHPTRGRAKGREVERLNFD
jgi:hypothetical protein